MCLRAEAMTVSAASPTTTHTSGCTASHGGCSSHKCLACSCTSGGRLWASARRTAAAGAQCQNTWSRWAAARVGASRFAGAAHPHGHGPFTAMPCPPAACTPSSSSRHQVSLNVLLQWIFHTDFSLGRSCCSNCCTSCCGGAACCCCSPSPSSRLAVSSCIAALMHRTCMSCTAVRHGPCCILVASRIVRGSGSLNSCSRGCNWNAAGTHASGLLLHAAVAAALPCAVRRPLGSAATDAASQPMLRTSRVRACVAIAASGWPCQGVSRQVRGTHSSKDLAMSRSVVQS
mmetsp:Transcript_21333/g.54301  ORF Transcript_21333/g.54301 Transcript_21333/m.54301 type:complete len:288 (+) Transcript_21333:601-1464(+)